MCIFSLEGWKLVADFVVGVSWPAAVVLTALVFKKEIGAMLPQVSEAGPGGLKFREPRPSQQQPPAVENVNSERSQFSAVLQGAMTSLQKELKDLPPDEKIERLIRHAAIMQVSAYFESVYANIFGSQIKALQTLNSLQTSTEADARAFYDSEAVAKNPEAYANFSFERWVAFLVNGGLVDHANETYSITDLGREFLVFIGRRHYRPDRPL
jgi:hypothetical protein